MAAPSALRPGQHRHQGPGQHRHQGPGQHRHQGPGQHRHQGKSSSGKTPERADEFATARELLHQFKRETYAFGDGALEQVGRLATPLGRLAFVVRPSHPGSDVVVEAVLASLDSSGIFVATVVPGVRPNAPRADLLRLADQVRAIPHDLVVAIGGGSTIDAAKAAVVLHVLGGSVDDYFGTGLVSDALSARTLTPLVAVQTAASSSAHLTKYSNITDLSTGQKKLIVDEAIVPAAAVFQYDVTCSMPPGLTADGALDGHSHALEVLYGAGRASAGTAPAPRQVPFGEENSGTMTGQPGYDLIERVATEAIRLIVNYLEPALHQPDDPRSRTALGLATDLGGYAIMLGGTNGGHLTSFSLVDLLSHGRACALLNPYYTVFFAPAIEKPLRAVGSIYQEAGLIDSDVDLERLGGRELGLVVAEGMLGLSRLAGIPTTLEEVPGFSATYIDRALVAAKDPQLRMKLENMPVPLTSERVDEYMGSVLEAARTGDLTTVKRLSLGKESDPT